MNRPLVVAVVALAVVGCGSDTAAPSVMESPPAYSPALLPSPTPPKPFIRASLPSPSPIAIPSPVEPHQQTLAQLRAMGVSAICNDGTYSYSQHRSGTCSHHRGVAIWTGLI
jgi:hypothetical protein